MVFQYYLLFYHHSDSTKNFFFNFVQRILSKITGNPYQNNFTNKLLSY